MSSPSLPPITGIDTHAHVFSRALPLTNDRRYSPDYDALVTTYLANIERCGLSHGVLVQPSFLGTDNSFMLDALRTNPARLRGIAVVEPSIREDELDELAQAGVVGIRLNLIGRPLDDYAQPHWQAFFKKLAQRSWQVEIQRGMEDFDQILPAILTSGVTVVIDHFGLPKGGIDRSDSHHRAFLALLKSEQLWIKLSATYRSQSGFEQAQAMVSTLREACGGSDRFLWGSDWPHTRFEDVTNYAAQFEMINALLPDPLERKNVLVTNPAWLFQFEDTL